MRTDAPPEAHELMACGVLSALAGPALRLPLATSITGVRLPLWTMYVVDSTTGRKTTVSEIGRDVLEEVLGSAALLQWEGSPQAIIQRLAERDGLPTVYVRDEMAGLLGQMNRPGGHLAGLEQTLIRAYDGLPVENLRTKKLNKTTGMRMSDSDHAADPYLILLCATTRTAFLERAHPDNFRSGFLARFIFLTGHADPAPPPRLTDAVRAAREDLLGHAKRFLATCHRVSSLEVPDAVLDASWQLELASLARAETATRPDVAEPALKRLAETSLKIAAFLALDRCDDGAPRVILTLDDFAVGAQLVERWTPHTLAIAADVGATAYQRHVEAIRAFIARYPGGVRFRDVLRAHRYLRKRDLEDCIETLVARDDVRTEGDKRPDHGGRAAVVLLPVPSVPNVPRVARVSSNGHSS